MDSTGNLFYFSYLSKTIFMFNTKTREETMMENVEQLNPPSEQIGKNITCSNDRKFVFFRKSFNKISIYNVEIAEKSSNKNSNSERNEFLMQLSINGKIVQMLNLYDRLVVITSSGVLLVLNQNLWDKQQIIARKKEFDLEIDAINEIVTCACFSFDCEFLVVCTQAKLDKEKGKGAACCRVRLYKVIKANEYRLINKWDDKPYLVELLKTFRNVSIEFYLNNSPLIMLTKYGFKGGKKDAMGDEQELNDFVCLHLELGKLVVYC
jgi:WD40 repeat protein